MTTIFAGKTSASTCPPGCAGHLPGDDGAVHISTEQVVVATAYGQRREVYSSIELDAGPDAQPVIRLTGAPDTPMSPVQALQLAAVLTAQAFTAVSSWQVTS